MYAMELLEYNQVFVLYYIFLLHSHVLPLFLLGSLWHPILKWDASPLFRKKTKWRTDHYSPPSYDGAPF